MTIACDTHWIGELMTTKQVNVSLDEDEQQIRNTKWGYICVPVDSRGCGSIDGG
jgi:hypothetical protein